MPAITGMADASRVHRTNKTGFPSMNASTTLCLLTFFAASLSAEEPTTKTFVYKTTLQGELEMVVHFPPDGKPSDRRPGIIFFFGGGWTNGTVNQFEPQANYLAQRGMVAARADYRVKSRHGITPKECVEDAKSALRYMRSHASEWGIDPDRIVAAGGSAGGHLAACTSLTPGLDAAEEDRDVSSQPNALILFNPALNFSSEPRLLSRIGNDAELGKLLSPTLHISPQTPPTLLLFGTADPLIKQGEEFIEKARANQVKVEMFTAEGAKHGFFNQSPWLERTTLRVDTFLKSLGYLEGEPTLGKDDRLTPGKGRRAGK